MVVKRLIYITTINLLSKRAQSIQIIRFVKSLAKVSEEDEIIFKAFSLSPVPINYGIYFNTFNKKLSHKRIVNNIKMIFFLLKNKSIKNKDIIYSRDLFLLFIFSLFGFKCFYEFHHPSRFINNFLFKVFNLLPRTRIITISNALKKYVIDNNFYSSKEILVLPSCVDVEIYDNSPGKIFCRKFLGFSDNKYYILHTGSPYIGRGVEKFVELCKFSEIIYFIHIGGEISDLKRLELLAKKEKISNCLFLPYIKEKDIIKYQKGADLLFHVLTEQWPTFWCCSPLKIPEYMASGTPILSSKLGSITEMIDERTAFLFDTNTSLRRNLNKLILNKNLGIKKAIVAKDKVKKKFTWDIRSRLLTNFLKKYY